MEPTAAPAAPQSGDADKEVAHRVEVKLCIKTFWTRSAEEIAQEAAEEIHVALRALGINRMPLKAVVSSRKRRLIGHYHVRIAFELRVTPDQLEQLRQRLRTMLKRLKKKHWSIRKTPLRVKPLSVPVANNTSVAAAPHRESLDVMAAIGLLAMTAQPDDRTRELQAILGRPQQA